jgi:hypothetical protein
VKFFIDPVGSSRSKLGHTGQLRSNSRTHLLIVIQVANV